MYKLFIVFFFTIITQNIFAEAYFDNNVIKFYKSEIKKHPFPRSKISITAQAQLRGSQIDRKYAEAFEAIKIIE